jgi:hypothetical protein
VADVQAAESRDVVVDHEELAMIPVPRPPGKLQLPREDRVERFDAPAAAAELAEHVRPAAERADGVVQQVDLDALAGLLAEQPVERLARLVVGEDVDLEADAALRVLDRLVRGVQRFAVLVELEFRAVG